MAKANNSGSDSPPLSAAKRRKAEDDETSNMSSKKARTRVSFSCGECHRRKQKCDRQIPCSHCIARKVPELCKAYTPGKTDQDLGVRLARLEHIIEMALPQYFSSSHSPSLDPAHSDRHRSPSYGPEDDKSHPDEQDPSGGSLQRGKWYGNSASGSVATASVLEQLQNVVGPSHDGHSSPQLAVTTNGENGRPPTHKREHSNGSLVDSSIIDSVREDSEPSAADNLKSLVQECGVPPHKISELAGDLPPERFSSVLIDFYFTSMTDRNWTRYPLNEKDFRAAYQSICTNGVSVNPVNARFLPLLFVVLAIAVRLAPENLAGDARTRRLTSLRYYWSSRRSLLIAAAIQPDSLDMVLTRLLSARFLTFDRRITECWSQLGAAVRTAQALGLHRDGSTMGIEPIQTEYRRRIWSYLYHADRSYALVLGRPNAIQDDYTSTLPPLNLDEEPTLEDICNPQPLSSPTIITFGILRHLLASIIGRMVHHFQQVRTPSHYSDVLALDDDLLRFVKNLPPHFGLEPDTSLDTVHKFIPIHRFLLITEILFVRVSLHRPYILRRLGSDRYQRSRTACFESAIKDFQVRKEFRESMSREIRDSLNNAYREFQTAMISGIYLVLDPNGPHADSMHDILDAFMRDHEGLREMDETTRRELKTIEFLKRKAEDAQHNTEGSTGSTEANGTSHSGDAQLLLSLQQVAARPMTSRPSFPSLTIAKSPTRNTSSPNTSPSLSFAHVPQVIAQSPAIQRLQHSGLADSNTPSGSGSPSGDDESSAQSLLDRWCDSVGSGPPVDGGLIPTGMSWGGLGPGDLSGWGTTTTTDIFPSDSQVVPGTGIDGSDWNYWETLVNHIRSGPAV